MIEGADHLYKEIRIDNALTNTSGQEVHLKSGAKVEVMIKAQTLSCLKNDRAAIEVWSAKETGIAKYAADLAAIRGTGVRYVNKKS